MGETIAKNANDNYDKIIDWQAMTTTSKAVKFNAIVMLVVIIG